MPTKTSHKLTNKQQLFVSAYVANGFNARQAAITAQYAPQRACFTGSRLVSYGKIQAAIAEKLKPLVRQHNIDADKIIAEFTEIAFARKKRPWGRNTMQVRADNKISALTKLAEICRLIQRHEPPQQQAQQVIVNILANGKPIKAEIIDDDTRTDRPADTSLASLE
jgi:hypothetical protein